MLYETLSHPKLLVIFLLTGFVCGLVFDIGNFIKFLFCNKKTTSVILDFCQTALSILIAFLINLKLNYGEIIFFPVLIVLVSFIIERLTLGKIIAKFIFSCYNVIIKLNKKLWGKINNGKTNKAD